MAPRNRINSALTGLVTVGILAGAAYAYWASHNRAGDADSGQDSAEIEKGIVAKSIDGVIHLTLPHKIAVSTDIRWQTIHSSDWNDERVVPAKLELDPARHYAVTAPADVIVEELVAPLGSQVRQGDPLVEMSSSQITTLRGGLLRQQLLTEKARQSVDWHKGIQSRVEEIVAEIERTSDEPNSEWHAPKANQTAEFGAKIISAFAKYWAATQISRISEMASNSGIVAEKSIVERLTDRASAKANLNGAIEQARFEIQQAILAAESELAAAEGSLQSIQSDTRKYLGLRNWDDDAAKRAPHPEMPDRFIHRSPGSGTVLERYFANGERASTGELIVLVADITKLWLVGDLRLHDWDLLQLHPGDSVQAEIVGVESMGRVPATIEMVGGVVQANSGSIRLTASLSNTDNLLRPGMVARLIMSRSVHSIRIPSGSIFSNGGVDYVLTRGAEDECRLQQVVIGASKQEAVEILSGIQDGDVIMVEGVFPIASQAFLEKE